MVVPLTLASLPRAVAALALVAFSDRSASALPARRSSPAGLSRCTTRSGAAGCAPIGEVIEAGADDEPTGGETAADVVEGVVLEVAVDAAASAADSAQPTRAIPTSATASATPRLAIASVNRRPSPCQPIESRIP